MALTAPRILSPDKALDHPDHDRLGYSDFSKALGDSIMRASPSEGVVIGVIGGWGSGKTSILNFTVYHLLQLPAENRPEIVQFNPWWFSGHEDLARQFLNQLAIALGRSKKLSEVSRLLREYGEIVSEVPLPLAGPLGKMLTKVPHNKNVLDLKMEISRRLSETPKKIVVIVDDLDRLASDDLPQVFKVIKAVADFPKVTYVVAFDREAVVRAFASTGQADPGDYLRKIVQVPIEIPLPKSGALTRLLLENISAISGINSAELADLIEERSREYFRTIIPWFFRTPREVARFSNVLSFTHSQIGKEVDIIDLISVEILRIFHPAVYESIRANPRHLTGILDPMGIFGESPDRTKSYMGRLKGMVGGDSWRIVEPLLNVMFPKLRELYSDDKKFRYPGPDEGRIEQRICHPQVFSIYFRYSVPDDFFSISDFDETLAQFKTTADPEKVLLSLDRGYDSSGSSRLTLFLERFQTSEAAKESDLNFLVARTLAGIGDFLGHERILEAERFVIRFLIGREKVEREQIILDLIKGSPSIAFVCDIIEYSASAKEDLSSAESSSSSVRILDGDAIVSLRLTALAMIRKAAADGSLLSSLRLARILHLWKTWNGVDEPKEWAERITSHDQGLVTFIAAFRNEIRGGGATTWMLDPRAIGEYLDLDDIQRRVKELSSNSTLNDYQLSVCDLFLKGRELTAQGANPSLMVNWIRTEFEKDGK